MIIPKFGLSLGVIMLVILSIDNGIVSIFLECFIVLNRMANVFKSKRACVLSFFRPLVLNITSIQSVVELGVREQDQVSSPTPSIK